MSTKIEMRPFDKINKVMFAEYERVRKSGHWNMIMNTREAAEEAGLSIDTYMGVLKNYAALMKKFPDVRKQ